MLQASEHGPKDDRIVEYFLAGMAYGLPLGLLTSPMWELGFSFESNLLLSGALWSLIGSIGGLILGVACKIVGAQYEKESKTLSLPFLSENGATQAENVIPSDSIIAVKPPDNITPAR
jgi:hypothetical protein